MARVNLLCEEEAIIDQLLEEFDRLTPEERLIRGREAYTYWCWRKKTPYAWYGRTIVLTIGVIAGFFISCKHWP